MVGPSSPYRRLSEIVGGDLPSLLSFRSAGGGTWVVAGCRGWLSKACSLQSMIRTIYPGMIYCRPGMMLASVVCSSLRDPDRGVRHVSSWGETARVDPDRGAHHVSSEKGSLHLPHFMGGWQVLLQNCKLKEKLRIIMMRQIWTYSNFSSTPHNLTRWNTGKKKIQLLNWSQNVDWSKKNIYI